MVELRVKLPKSVQGRMKRFPEVNWPGFLEKAVEKKVEELSKMEELLKQLEEEEDVTDWAVKLQRSSRRGRFDELKRRGLI